MPNELQSRNAKLEAELCRILALAEGWKREAEATGGATMADVEDTLLTCAAEVLEDGSSNLTPTERETTEAPTPLDHTFASDEEKLPIDEWVDKHLPPACLTPSEGATLAERMYCWYNAGGPADRAGLNFQGNPCPVWTELPEAVRAKWEAVASAAAFDLHGLIRSGVVRGVGEREDPAALHWDMGYRAALRWIGAAFGQHTDFDSWDTSEVEHLRVCVVDEIKRGMGPRNTLTGLAGACADLREFNHRAGVPNRQTPMLPEDPRENAPLWAELRTTVERFEGAESNIKLFHTGEVALMARLMVSEMTETLDALSNNDIVGFADGLADGIYVHVQAAMRCGIPLEKVWAAVQAANLSKFPMCSPCAGTGWVKTEGVSTAGGYTVVGGVEGQCPFCHGIGTIVLRDANGKVMKPPGFTPPDIATILKGGA